MQEALCCQRLLDHPEELERNLDNLCRVRDGTNLLASAAGAYLHALHRRSAVPDAFFTAHIRLRRRLPAADDGVLGVQRDKVDEAWPAARKGTRFVLGALQHGEVRVDLQPVLRRLTPHLGKHCGDVTLCIDAAQATGALSARHDSCNAGIGCQIYISALPRGHPNSNHNVSSFLLQLEICLARPTAPSTTTSS